MTYITKKIAYLFSAVLALGMVFGLFAPTALAASVSLQAPMQTLRAANYSDCPGCVNWNDEGATHATGDADSRPIVSLGIAYMNNSSTMAATGVTVRLSPQSGNGGTTTFNGKVWASNAPQIQGNATVTIPGGQTLEFTGQVYHYINGSMNPVAMNNPNSIFSGLSLGTIGPGQYGGVVARFRVEGDTTPPPPEYDLTVNTLSATEVTETSAKLRGESRTDGTAADVWFEYATSASDLSNTGNGSQGGTTTPDYGQGASFQWLSHFRTVNNLQSNTTYYYQVCAETGNLIECDPYETFTTQGQIINNPVIQIDTLPEQAVTEDSATLRGQVVEQQDGNVTTWFEYGTNQSNVSNGNGATLSVSGTFGQGNIFSRNLTGLANNTTYYYRACGQDQNNHQDCGSVENFSTNDQIVNNPNILIDTLDAQDEDEDSARLFGYVDEEEDGNVDTWFEWDDNSNSVANGNGTTLNVSGIYDQGDTFDVVLSGLDDNTTYYFRACGQDQNGNLDCGPVEQFTTDGNNGNGPDIETQEPDNVDEDSAELNGEYDMNDFEDGDIFFVWSDNENDLDDVEDEDNINDVEDFVEVEVVDQNVDGNDEVSETISGLDEDTTYYYQLCVLYEDDNGDDVIECGQTEEFTTDGEEIEPEQNDRPIPQSCVAQNVGITSATLTARVNGNGQATNSYFQYGISQAFGSSTGSSATGSGTSTITKFASNLSPNTTYYCRVVAQNADGISYGDIGVFKTLVLPTINPDRPVTIVSSGGGVGSLIFLEIDDEQETAVRGQTLEYVVTWRNTSGRDLDEVVLNVRLPKSVSFLSSTDGRYNRRDHQVTVDIGELERGEEDDMTIFVQVRGGTEGDQLVAEAIIAFEDPQPNSGSLLSAIEYDVDTYTNGANGLLAGLFGIGLLPGLIGLLLAILLILIIVLTARRLTDPRRTEYRG